MTSSQYKKRTRRIRAMALSGMTLDQIYAAVGGCRKRLEKTIKETLAGPRIIYPPAGTLETSRRRMGRCPGCGALACLPCLACQLTSKLGKV